MQPPDGSFISISINPLMHLIYLSTLCLYLLNIILFGGGDHFSPLQFLISILKGFFFQNVHGTVIKVISEISGLHICQLCIVGLFL